MDFRYQTTFATFVAILTRTEQQASIYFQQMLVNRKDKKTTKKKIEYHRRIRNVLISDHSSICFA